MRFKNKYWIVCRDRHGNIKWRHEKYNLVTNVGLNDVLNQVFAGIAYTPAWFIGLMNANGQSLSINDTAASHAGWSEVTNYAESTRQPWIGVAIDNNTADNSASVATFTMAGSGSCGGAFLISSSAKGGITGILFGGTGIAPGGYIVTDTITVEVSVTFAPPIG